MFTGLVEDIGTVQRAERHGDAVAFLIRTHRIDCDGLELGESIAVDGTCLTVTRSGNGHFACLAGNETLQKTTLGQVRPQSRVNLERALRLGDRLGGHMVMGHVDAVARLQSRRDLVTNLELTFRAPSELMKYIIVKGSIAIDGISLTVNKLDAYSFSVALIPHTVEQTTLAQKQVGSSVNIEVDMIGKYVERLLEGYKK